MLLLEDGASSSLSSGALSIDGLASQAGKSQAVREARHVQTLLPYYMEYGRPPLVNAS
jgi:hypothetical protein